MPGNVAGAVDVPLNLFGGLVTDMAPADLPHGVSPDCADVVFSDGGVRTRPGLVSAYAPLSGNPTVNYLKTYITLNQTLRLLLLDSNGVLYKEISPGTLATIASGLAVNAYARSATLFGREYLAISDGRAGKDLPRQYDDANFDRISQVGPGAAPSAADEAGTAANITATGVSRSNNVVTITTAAAHGFQVGWSVVIGGVTDSSFNGTFTIVSVPSATTFTYAQTAANATSGNGTATANPAGNIAPGAHKVVVIFKTRQGYLTAPSPAASWTAAGGRRVVVTNIPTGPANVGARIVAFTGASGASFYFTSAMVIPDNITTATTLDFSEAQLLAGTNVDSLFKLIELGECSGVIDYAGRLFWWGERNKQNNWLNLSFDGDWNPASGMPLGWTVDPTFGAGGSRESSAVIWGDAYRIAGDGAAATRGLITQGAAQDANGVALISPNVDYSVRARARAGGGITQGRLTVDLYSATGGIDTTGLQVTAAQAGTSFAEFTARLTDGGPLASIPSDLVLRVFVEGTPTSGGYFIVDNIEIYPTAQPVNVSLVRASRVEDPESYDGVNGILSVAENNGQAIRAAFRLRERLYFVKEHSLYVTEDDGVNEPSLWSIGEVSRSVGTPSIHGVDVGEDWAAIADRSGLYLFWGGEPVKISQEIQPTWDSINWAAGHTLWVRVDTRNKRILCGVPIAPATSPNRVLVLDYRGLASAEEIASRAPVHISLAGKLVAGDKARKWAPWFITANAATLAERSDGTAQVFLGNGAGTGKIYQLSDAALSDDAAAINSYYSTYFFPEESLEQGLGLGSHRKLFCYLSTFVEGAGLLSLTAFINSTGSTSAQQPFALSNPATKDLELPINLLGERVSFKLGTNAAGNWFRLQRFVPVVRPDPWAPIRGVN